MSWIECPKCGHIVPDVAPCCNCGYNGLVNITITYTDSTNQEVYTVYNNDEE